MYCQFALLCFKPVNLLPVVSRRHSLDDLVFISLFIYLLTLEERRVNKHVSHDIKKPVCA